MYQAWKNGYLFFLENALFRIEAMWDIFAQIYNIMYSIGLRNTNMILYNTKTKYLIVLISILFCILFSPLVVYADNGDTIVHVTNTGACYHRAGCGHLRSDKEITLYEAVVEYGYNPCEDCQPPIYDGPEEPHSLMDKPQGGGDSSSNRNTSNVVERQASNTTEKPKDGKNFSTFIASLLLYTFLGVFVLVKIVDTSTGKGRKGHKK